MLRGTQSGHPHLGSVLCLGLRMLFIRLHLHNALSLLCSLLLPVVIPPSALFCIASSRAVGPGAEKLLNSLGNERPIWWRPTYSRREGSRYASERIFIAKWGYEVLEQLNDDLPSQFCSNLLDSPPRTIHSFSDPLLCECLHMPRLLILSQTTTHLFLHEGRNQCIIKRWPIGTRYSLEDLGLDLVIAEGPACYFPHCLLKKHPVQLGVIL
mmetsp:Transcript_7658/g.9913  ORF Transcript_7658/g.9913 Transcript_7658/m.9913 type:complete len:211 (-) Transcript_7658:72-704(-)